MPGFRTMLLCFPVMLLLAACASRSSSGASTGSSCELAPADSLFAAAGPVYRECAVDRRARLLNRSRNINYQPSGPRPAPGERCYYAEIEFVVDTQGRPETRTARVLRSNEPTLGSAVLQSLPDWRYAPAQKGGVPVRQIVRDRYGLALVVTVVRVPAGSLPPTGPPPPSRRPMC
jgi:hypothetical protein